MTTHFEAMIASFYRQVAELGNQIDTAGISQEERDILIRKYNTLLTNLEGLEKRVEEFRNQDDTKPEKEVEDEPKQTEKE